MDIEAIKYSRLQMKYINLTEWLKDHQEWVDDWGSELDKIAIKKQ